VAGRLKLFERTGCGGSAEVYRGALVGERGTQRLVAVKKLHPELCSDAARVELFVQEARVTLSLAHPHVLHALELMREADDYALVYEWVDGCSLTELYEHLGPLDWPCVIYVGRALASALGYLHAQEAGGIVHRDVAPTNVLITAAGVVKLCDFGIARVRESRVLFEVKAGGTEGFRAPEQARGAAVDARADVYGLGMTLRAAAAADLPAALAHALERAAAVEPSERFESAAAFDASLAAIAHEMLVSVGPQTLAQWVSEHGGLSWARRPVSLDGPLERLLPAADRESGAERHSVASLNRPKTAAQEPARSARARRQRHRLVALASVLGLAALAAWTFRGGWRESGASAGGSPAPRVSPHQAAPAAASLSSEVAHVNAAAGATDAGAPDAESPDAKAPGARPPAAAPLSLKRWVSLNVRPWAGVSVDGHWAGNTPLRVELSVGAHRLRLKHPQRVRDVVIDVGEGNGQVFVIDLFSGAIEHRDDN
jgi:tRNA A-37 threonylcarbamoyl transferase component Bud32